ncbi:uncharacterized protein LOC123894933 isoform X5 [Trifolium pratense]|uniref:uncharacterized protein LOC123894933 isoform X5 n=1 Tax=Trifolium pratense TaxID=57577 RepID=UPI001E691332|nr:uncharacterized protein LOC123894933 isoform X5 [Trifolium pratense]
MGLGKLFAHLLVLRSSGFSGKVFVGILSILCRMQAERDLAEGLLLCLICLVSNLFCPYVSVLISFSFIPSRSLFCGGCSFSFLYSLKWLVLARFVSLRSLCPTYLCIQD